MPSGRATRGLLPPDARRAVARARDALAAAFSRAVAAGVAVESVRVELLDPETALPVEGLTRAIEAAARRTGAPLVPGGGWSGAPFASREGYVTAWELEAIAACRAREGERLLPVGEGAPVRASRGGVPRAALAFSPWLVHSFAGRKRHSRPDVAALVPASARTVLDVGCGEGHLGEGLEARGARVTGIESDESAAAAAERRLSRVLSCPAEEAVEHLDVRPDVVILADVLEHLESPAEVLRALRGVLAPGGSVVFSLPNVTHAAVLGGALRGRWDRQLEGVVADDHRTYAGRPGWTALLSFCGLRVTSLRAVLAPTPFSGPDRAALLSSTSLEPDDLDAVQWLGTAEPAAPSGETLFAGGTAPHGPLESEDPVQAVRDCMSPWPVSLRAANAVRATTLETLLAGGLAAGSDAGGLLHGWTARGLASRFEGSGLTLRVEPAAHEELPAGVRAAVEARLAAGLSADQEAISVREWELSFAVPGS